MKVPIRCSDTPRLQDSGLGSGGGLGYGGSDVSVKDGMRQCMS